MKQELAQLAAAIKGCRICVEQPLGTPLPHEPRPVVRLSAKARICIAGQAPGIRVHESGIPFNDPSGDRLRDWMGVDRSQFYDENLVSMVPMGFCFPGYDKHKSDLPPRKECARAWHAHIFDSLPQLELMLVIGSYAQSYHLRELSGKSVTETVANWRNIHEQTQSPKILPLPHPSWRNSAWIKRHPWFEAELLKFLRRQIANLI